MDTGAFVAVAEPGDEHHDSALSCMGELADKHLPLLVTVPTIYETHRRLLYGPGRRHVARRFLEGVYDGSVNIESTIGDDETRAIQLIDRYWDLALTITDAGNMAVMERLGIATAFSFDRHYLQAGFIRVPPLFL
jgi:predicted nucleic acid-binding protein